MTAITTAAAGNWSAPGTWTGGVVPGNGDTVTLNHNVTVDVATIVGSSPATGGTPAIAWGTANVVLTINANLTLRGDIVPKDDFTLHDLVIQAAGVTVTFDATQAAAPSTTNYRCLLWNDNVDWRWKFNGTAAQPCVLQSAAGAGVGFFYNNAHSGGPRINAAYTHFLRIGDAANQATTIFFGGAAPEFTLDHCVVDTCGTFQAKNGGSTSLLSVTNTVFKNGVGGNGDMQTGIIESATTPGLIDNCYFAGFIEGAWGAMKLTNNVFKGVFIADADSASAAFQYNLVSIKGAVGCPGTVDHCYMLDFDNTDANPQGLKPAGFNHDITFCLFESSYPTQAAGDLIINGNGSAFTYNVKNNILIPNADGTSPGKLCSLIAAASASHFVVEHNTVVSNWSTGNESGVIQYGESGGGAVGEVTSLKSNLAWSSVAGNNAVQIGRLQGTQQDEVTAANTGYNATWNGANGGTDPVGYISATAGSIFSAVGAGAHDIVLSANPFVDSTRNFSKWGASLGGAGTNADTLDMLRKRLDWTDVGYAPSNGATVSALVAWVSDGFKVTARSLYNAGHDGVTIGAMPFKALRSVLGNGVVKSSVVGSGVT